MSLSSLGMVLALAVLAVLALGMWRARAGSWRATVFHEAPPGSQAY